MAVHLREDLHPGPGVLDPRRSDEHRPERLVVACDVQIRLEAGELPAVYGDPANCVVLPPLSAPADVPNAATLLEVWFVTYATDPLGSGVTETGPVHVVHSEPAPLPPIV